MTTDQPERPGLGLLWKAAAGFLVLILLIGAVIVGMSYLREDSQASPALPEPDGATVSEPAPRDPVDPSNSTNAEPVEELDGACDLPVGDQNIPTGSPEARWELIDGAGLPISEEFGPHAEDGDARVCYPHNPTGALFAAANILPRVYLNEEVRSRQITSGPMRDQVDRDAERSPRDSVPVQTVGYRIDAYTPASAEVVLVVQQSDAFLAVPFRVVWADGDWKGDGSDVNVQPPYEVQSLTGFTEWTSS